MAIHFSNPNDPDNVKLKAALNGYVQEVFPELDQNAIDWEAHDCGHETCLHAQTTLRLRLGDGSERKVELFKPMVFLRKADILAALR